MVCKVQPRNLAATTQNEGERTHQKQRQQPKFTVLLLCLQLDIGREPSHTERKTTEKQTSKCQDAHVHRKHKTNHATLQTDETQRVNIAHTDASHQILPRRAIARQQQQQQQQRGDILKEPPLNVCGRGGRNHSRNRWRICSGNRSRNSSLALRAFPLRAHDRSASVSPRERILRINYTTQYFRFLLSSLSQVFALEALKQQRYQMDPSVH